MQQIKIGDTLIDVVSVYGAKRDMLGSIRDSLEIKVISDYETVVNTFVDGITYLLVQNIETMNEDGTITTSVEEYDKSNYCLSGDIVDHRDGTLSVYMGVRTDVEELLIALYGGAE